MQVAVAAKLSAQSGLELSQQGATMQNSITALFELAVGLQSAPCFAVDERTTNEHISQQGVNCLRLRTEQQFETRQPAESAGAALKSTVLALQNSLHARAMRGESRKRQAEVTRTAWTPGQMGNPG